MNHLADESFDRTASHMAGEYVSYSTKTLTDEEINKIAQEHGVIVDAGVYEFAKAILRKRVRNEL
jgi:microsomal dipeptidase-like Zn-dependent dipeptidase